jgi:SAM-dependent methyltransferase
MLLMSLMSVFIILLLIWLCILILTILGMYLWSEAKHYFYHQAPTVGTYSRHFNLMKKKLKLPDWASVIDLGCGDGGVLRFMSDHYHLSILDGVDNNLTAVWRWKFFNYLFNKKNINLHYGDIQDTDISQYDIVYLFLLSKHLDNLQSRLQKNMKSDAIIVCNTFEFSDRIPYQVLRSSQTGSVIRLYKK